MQMRSDNTKSSMIVPSITGSYNSRRTEKSSPAAPTMVLRLESKRFNADSYFQ